MNGEGEGLLREWGGARFTEGTVRGMSYRGMVMSTVGI